MKRGRRGEAELASVAGVISAHKRPEPPECLEPAAAEEWRKVVDGLPADWFSVETHALLEDRCRHVVWARFVALEIDALIRNKNAGEEFDARL